MPSSFFEQPVLNSPYAAPRYHHALDEHGQPVDVPPVEGRRRSEIVTAVPMPRMRSRQGTLALGDHDASTDEQEYNPTPIINEIHNHVASWRALPNPADWRVIPTSARLLTYRRSHQFSGKPFFCQLEAVGTIVGLTEVASRRPQSRSIRAHLEDGKPTLTPHHQRAEAIKRRDKAEESPALIARSYNVSRWTISRLSSADKGFE